MTYKRQSLIAGILYISLVFVGPFTLLVLPEMFMGHNSITAYVSENTGLIWLWILGDFVLIGIELVLTTLLFMMFKQVSKELSLFAFIARLSMIVVMVVNVIVLFVVLGSLDQSDIYVTNLFNTHHSLIYVWQIFFFIHLLILGVLVYKATNIKSWIGIGLFIGSFAYILDSVNYFAVLNSNVYSTFVGVLLGIVALSEIIFGIYMIITKKESVIN